MSEVDRRRRIGPVGRSVDRPRPPARHVADPRRASKEFPFTGEFRTPGLSNGFSFFRRVRTRAQLATLSVRQSVRRRQRRGAAD